MKLIRTDFTLYGVFGEIGNWMTLEHSFNGVPIIPPGTYTCVRGLHLLPGTETPFETFEITGVDGHSGLLFHPGNFNADSHGCVLLGKARLGGMIANSRVAFKEFMDSLDGQTSFQIEIT